MSTTTRSAVSLRVVLVSPKHEGNVGSAARAMANFALDDLWLVAPRCAPGREALALAAHAAPVLRSAHVVATLDEALEDRTMVAGTSARPRASAAHLASAPELALARLRGHAAALVFGPEDTGLDNAALDRCDLVLTIPTAPYASLNLAQSVAVLAYLWFAGRGGERLGGGIDGAGSGVGGTADREQAEVPPRIQVEPPQRQQVEAMLEQFEALALRTGYTDDLRSESMMRHMRRVFARAATSADDVARLRGLWSHLHGALERAEGPLAGGRGDADGGS